MADNENENNNGDDAEEAQDEQPQDQRRVDGRHYADSGSRRDDARQSCIERAVSEYSFAPDEVNANAVRWIGEGTISVSLDTPNGAMACTVDRNGETRLIDRR